MSFINDGHHTNTLFTILELGKFLLRFLDMYDNLHIVSFQS